MPFIYCVLLALLLFRSTDIHAGGPFNVIEVGIEPAPPPGRENARVVVSLLAVFLGPFGAHRLYLGTNVKVAVIYGITFGGFGILPLLDLGHVLFSKDLDRYRDNDRVFMWSQGKVTPP